MGLQYDRQEILEPVGLVTEPNQYKQYPSGALKRARNVLLRAPGKLFAAPNTRNSLLLSDPDAVLYKLIPTGLGKVHAIVDNSGLWEIWTDGVLATHPNVPKFSRTGRISWAECNRRIIINGASGCIAADPDPISTDFRAPGLPQPVITDVGYSGPDGWLDGGQSVQYRACFVRRYADLDSTDDYVLRSVPSVPHRLLNTLAPGNKRVATLHIKWPATLSGLEPGDKIELYRTNVLSGGTAYSDTGDTYKLVQEYTLTAADLAAPPASGLLLTDTQATVTGTLVTPGRELYTNPGVEGELYANLRPPVAEVIVAFKGFVFYLNTTERAFLSFSVPGGWGDTSVAAAAGVPNSVARVSGIGVRRGTGVRTIGTATITAVPAGDEIGIVPGQRWDSTGFPPDTRVVSAVVGTITLDKAALSSSAGAVSWAIADTIEINGVVYTMGELGAFLGFGNSTTNNASNGLFEAQVNTAIPGVGVYLASFEMKLMFNGSFPYGDSSLAVRATNGQNYSPVLPTMTETAKNINGLHRPNRYVWTKEQQPEHAPSASEGFAGFGEIYAANATRDCVWIWCSDGVFRLSGNAGSLGLGAWQLDYANATLLLCAPQASTSLADKVYGYTNEGVVEIDSAGNLSHKTQKIIGDLLPGPRYEEVPHIIMERDERNDEVLLVVDDQSTAGFGLRLYVFNTKQKGWTYCDDNDDPLAAISAMAMFRLPPGGAEAHVLIGTSPNSGAQPMYSSWNADNSFLEGEGRYQPVYGQDPLELKRWMWADYLFGEGTTGSITALWNEVLGFGPVNIQSLDAGVYARAGVPRQVGLSHSISPGFRWAASSAQRVFQGISLAVLQRTNQSKKR